MKKILKQIVVAILTAEAKLALARHKPRVVAITGNVGKTSTKDAVAAVLSQAYGSSRVRKSYKNFNSEIGAPLSILDLDTAWSSASGWLRNICKGFVTAAFSRKFPEWLVLEVGADHPGDIESLSAWLRPDVAVLTRMADIPVHVEFFKDANEVLQEKMFLARAIKPGGVVVVNADDRHFMSVLGTIDDKTIRKAYYGLRAKSGMAIDAEIVESEIVYDGSAIPLPQGERAVIRVGGEDAAIVLKGVLGSHLVYPVAAACAVMASALANKSGRPTGVAALAEAAFRTFETPRGRMRVLSGLNSSAIVDDTYNSSPLATAEALRTMEKLVLKGKKIAALGDMKELGPNTEKAHYEIGRLAGEVLHTLVTVGPAAKFMVRGALDAGMSPDRVISFDAADEVGSQGAGQTLRDIVRAGDVVLVKGSQSMRMENVAKALLADPATAADVLVRQEEEWKGR